ncbi:hypothetical protein [Kiritimatiella glycovorans]|uniref:F5/8 type C domain-containing protein n=1 Tax=Kiritimatiella glycovorans TaxID=1307763 RepID=A0A0G3EHW0_9BACT|nr:hypothetical protein [Kiritimatiella glycovorans]AKJ64390.1 hypothetical protein L21SP4_01140 [Kiritimatiella glycovorans]
MKKKTRFVLVAVMCGAAGAYAMAGGNTGQSGGETPAGEVTAPEMVPLKPELPKPLFAGTPVPVKLPNLENRDEPRGEIMVPEGTELLSKNKPVSASDPFPVIGELEMVTDDDKSGDAGHFVELGPGVQWVQIDLEQKAELHAILLWHFHRQARAYHDVIVQVSDDPDFIEGVQTIFNNDHDNSAGMGAGTDPAYIETYEGRMIDPMGVEGRYVRLYSNGNTSDEMNHYVEVSVYGIP